MRHEPPDANAAEDEVQPVVASTPPPTLSGMSFTLGLVLLLGVFLFLNPIWAAADMADWNQNIWWSYAPIPLVVAVLLGIEGKLGGASLLLESLKLTLVKFTLTFAIAQVVWLVQGVPGTGLPVLGPVAVDADSERYTVRPAPPATELPAATESAGARAPDGHRANAFVRRVAPRGILVGTRGGDDVNFMAARGQRLEHVGGEHRGRRLGGNVVLIE